MFKVLVTSLIAASSLSTPCPPLRNITLTAFAAPLDPSAVGTENTLQAAISDVYGSPSGSNDAGVKDIINIDIPKIIATDNVRGDASFNDLGGLLGLLPSSDRKLSDQMLGDASAIKWVTSALPKFGRGLDVMKDVLDFTPARWNGIVSDFTSTTCVFACESPLVPDLDTTAVWLSALQDSLVMAATSFVTKEIVLPLHSLLDSISLDFGGVDLHLDGLDLLGGIELPFTII
jgi:hypothetical protein